MKTILSKFSEMTGSYVGEGINHENQPFTGYFELSPILDGRGFTLKFVAEGKDGTVYHKEESTIAPSIQQKLNLWNFNSNAPGLVPHELRSSDTKPGAHFSFVFGFGDLAEKNTFREEIALDIWNQNSLSYTYSWGMPGGEFQERSGVKMSRLPENHS